MATKPSASEYLKLSVLERLELVEDIWDSIAECPDAVEITPEQRAELDRRLADFHRNPASGSPWEAVKARIKSKL